MASLIAFYFNAAKYCWRYRQIHRPGSMPLLRFSPRSMLVGLI